MFDRGYLDLARLHRLHPSGAFSVPRAQKNFRFRRRYSQLADKTTGLRFDQTVVLAGFYAHRDYPWCIATRPLRNCSKKTSAIVAPLCLSVRRALAGALPGPNQPFLRP